MPDFGGECVGPAGPAATTPVDGLTVLAYTGCGDSGALSEMFSIDPLVVGTVLVFEAGFYTLSRNVTGIHDVAGIEARLCVWAYNTPFTARPLSYRCYMA
jgi:hypothetical protein